jgi:hypothetical protein
MAKVDDLLQSGTKQIILAVVAWLAHGCPPDNESRRRRNHEPLKSGIRKRKKTATHNRLSCKIEYLLRSNHGDSSIASEFFTGDYWFKMLKGQVFNIAGQQYRLIRTRKDDKHGSRWRVEKVRGVKRGKRVWFPHIYIYFRFDTLN